MSSGFMPKLSAWKGASFVENQDIKLHIDDTVFVLRLNRHFLDHCNDWNTARHCNANYELHIILKGTCKLDVTSNIHTLEAGKAIVIAPGEYHMPHVTSEEFLKLSVPFSLSENHLAKALRQAIPTSIVFALSPELRQLSHRILDELAATQAFAADLLPALLTDLMVCMFRSLRVCDSAGNSTANTPADWRTDVIDSFFEDNMACYGTEEQLADALHISKRQLARVLLEHYGMNFRQKLLGTRMDHAGWLLRTTRKSIGEICSIVGYNSETTFFKNFKNHYDMTPLQYRKQHQSTDI